jgi:hypothetical protein
LLLVFRNVIVGAVDHAVGWPFTLRPAAVMLVTEANRETG